jgi:muramoyltetrapeptide carboxypeptidase
MSLTIGIVAPADWVDRDSLQKGAAALERFGVKVKTHPCCVQKFGRMAGEDSARAEALNSFLADDSVDVLWCAKGGYGSYRLLDKIDFSLWQRTQKPLIGYSDATALLNAAYAKANIAGVHAPNIFDISAGMHMQEARATLAILKGEPLNPDQLFSSAEVLYAGSAEGVIVGGNLAAFTRLCGTEFLPKPENCILFLEEVCETNFRLDQFVRQLRLSGLDESIQGVVIGRMSDIADSTSRPFGFSLEEVWQQNFPEKPLIVEAHFGHSGANFPFKIGANYKLAAGSAITFEEV